MLALRSSHTPLCDSVRSNLGAMSDETQSQTLAKLTLGLQTLDNFGEVEPVVPDPQAGRLDEPPFVSPTFPDSPTSATSGCRYSLTPHSVAP